MEDKIVFDKDMWNTLISMLLSSFENLMHDFLGLTKDNAPGKGKLVYLYFSLLSKANRI